MNLAWSAIIGGTQLPLVHQDEAIFRLLRRNRRVLEILPNRASYRAKNAKKANSVFVESISCVSSARLLLRLQQRPLSA
jgi:hypothetical protein